MAELIVIDGFLKGAGMDPIEMVFSYFGKNPIIMNSPDAWIISFIPWLILFVAVALLAIFGRLIGLGALGLAYVSGIFFKASAVASGLGLVAAVLLAFWAVHRHVDTSSNPWWL